MKMNKQEAIEKIEKRKSTLNSWEELTRNRAFDEALDIVRKIDAPEKPVVPQFVADFYESIKDDFEVGVYDLCVNLYTCNLEGKIKYWFDCDDNKPIETLAKMKLYGYEIEKDKLYTVEIPIANSPLGYHYVLRKTISGEIIIDSFFTNNWGDYDYCQLTKAEIKKDHGWAWKYAEEVK